MRALVLTQLLVFYFAVLLGLPSRTRDRSVKEKEHQEKEEKTKRTDLDHRSDDDDDDKTKKKKKKKKGGGGERERKKEALITKNVVVGSSEVKPILISDNPGYKLVLGLCSRKNALGGSVVMISQSS